MPLVLLLVVLIVTAGSSETLFRLPDASPTADLSRLPVFVTSDPSLDSFANEWFMRHLSVDRERALHDYGRGVVLGATDHLWCVEWDAWYLPWIDRGAMGMDRQGGSDVDWQYYYLLRVPINKYGQVWGAIFSPEPKDRLGHWKPLLGWPWPKYNRDTSSPLPHGWEFNDPSDGERGKWKAWDIDLSPGYVDHSLEGRIVGPRPELVSPDFDADVYQVPIIELDIEYKGLEGREPGDLIGGLRIYWKTSDSPFFSEDKSISADFADLPPGQFPGEYASFHTDSSVRLPLYFLMCQHPKWGREGRRITKLKIVPAGDGAEDVVVSLNYVRASYDVRLYTTNGILINSAFRYYMWSGDDDFLREIMPRLRKAMIYMNDHLGGRKYGLIHSGWMVGKEGLGGEVGRSMYGSYWDLLPAGVFDIESSVHYYSALRSMAELERVVKAKGWHVSKVEVLGPDDQTRLSYADDARSLDSLADRVRKRIEDVFWVPETGRFCKAVDVNGKKHDYGFLHFNLWALAHGVGTKDQRSSILSWLDGSRIIEGDTSVGADIYRWRFGPHITTKRNNEWYYWAWLEDGKGDPPDLKWMREWGNQVQDGGTVPFTSFYDLLLRTSTGKLSDVDAAYDRVKEIEAWYADVKSAAGEGRDYYRRYYDGHPERGRLQSPMPGGLGLDREFLSDGSLATAFLPFAFLGLSADKDGILSIVPSVPSRLDKIVVRNVFYRRNHLDIEAGRGYVSLDGSRIPNPGGLRLSVTFRGVSGRFEVLLDGKSFRGWKRDGEGNITVSTSLKPCRIEIRHRK